LTRPHPPPSNPSQGRIVAAEYPRFWLVTVYVPNAGEKLVRLDYRVGEWDAAFAAFVASLASTKPVVVAGDLNVARAEPDIHNPKTNLRSAGFTVEERESFAEKLLGTVGLADPWRDRFPDKRGYTYWSYRFGCRPKNLGWRIDYVLTSPELSDDIHDAFQLPHVEGSDHCPVGIAIKGGVGGEEEGGGGC
jgi:exodeoxyribonuclease-3